MESICQIRASFNWTLNCALETSIRLVYRSYLVNIKASLYLEWSDSVSFKHLFVFEHRRARDCSEYLFVLKTGTRILIILVKNNIYLE